MCKKKGLIYSVLDKKGKKIGVPLKARSMSGSPNLKSQEKKFTRNKTRMQLYKPIIKNKID